MPRKPAVYGPRTNTAVRKAVKNFNAKITRELKKDPAAIAWLPDRVSVKQFKADYRMRADVNFGLASLRSFSTPGAVQKVELRPGEFRSAWEVKQLLTEAKRTNRGRAARLAEIKPNTRDGTMGYTEILNLNPMKTDLEKMSVKDFQRKRRTAKRESARDYDDLASRVYKLNYMEAVEKHLPNFAMRIRALIAPLTGAQMVRAYATDPALHIDYIYDPQHESARAQTIIEHWQDFLGQQPGEVDDSGDDWEGEANED